MEIKQAESWFPGNATQAVFFLFFYSSVANAISSLNGYTPAPLTFCS